MRTPAESAARWAEEMGAASRAWREALPPQEKLVAGTRAYVNGYIDLQAFEQIAAEAIRDGA